MNKYFKVITKPTVKTLDSIEDTSNIYQIYSPTIKQILLQVEKKLPKPSNIAP